MDEINFAQKPPENKLEQFVQKTLLFFGERLAILLFVLCIPVFFLFTKTPQAFSQQEKEVFVPQKEYKYEHANLQVPAENNSVEYSHKTATFVPSPTPTPIPVDANSNDVWDKLADCETHKNWSSDTGNGYFGGLQFNMSAWSGVGGSGKPSDASRDEQIMRGKMLQEKRGWGPWGGCSKKLGLL